MEVNVDILEQMDLMDISDQEALDVFLNSGSGADEAALTSPLPGHRLALSDPNVTDPHLSPFVYLVSQYRWYTSRPINNRDAPYRLNHFS